METSSPLAALQPSMLPGPWGQTRARPDFDNGFLRPCRPREFNFRDMSMRKSNSDYFSFKPAKGSSPTQSLAVDLSQNFHIDQSSPQLPTPRRALFTTNLFSHSGRHGVVTPPVPSSSPGIENDHMEFSPLPHKVPVRVYVQQVEVCSPTPEPEPTPAESCRPTEELRRSESEQENTVPVKPWDQRRSLLPSRPGIRKGNSTNCVPQRRPRTSEATRTFWFGAGAVVLKTPLETFVESPPSERKLAPSISNPSLVAAPMNATLTGSPVANPLPRRPIVSRTRTGLSRRTMSMQCNDSGRVIREQKRCCTTGTINPSLIPLDEYKLRLPHFKPANEIDALPRITRETLIDIIDGKFADQIGESIVVDCRFEYEYQGGHITEALNFNDKEEMARQLFESTSTSVKALIFHCEYSAHRAPLMAKYVRQRDRAVNQDAYPRLTYPEVYILDGGYSGFFSNHPHRCFPQSYVEMDSKDHESACEAGMARVKRRGKLARAQTYAFGQNGTYQSSAIASAVPRIPAGFPNLQCVDAMDVDFSSPVEIRADSAIEMPKDIRALARRFGSH